MSRKKKPQAHHEEHMDETWLIPYADLLTLLLALFIVLFASSQVDQKKFEQMAQSLNIAFSGNPALLQHPMPQQTMTNTNMPTPQTPETLSKVMANAEGGGQDQMRETLQLAEIKRMMDSYIANNNLTGDLQTALTEDGLVIRIKDTALFPSGSAELLPDSRRFATQIAKMLTALGQKVAISGHTDNVPINTAEFPSNWELSSKRALNFMRFLLAQEPKLEPTRFSATGFGEYRPVAPNNAEDGRSKNRRVEVLVMRNYRK